MRIWKNTIQYDGEDIVIARLSGHDCQGLIDKYGEQDENNLEVLFYVFACVWLDDQGEHAYVPERGIQRVAEHPQSLITAVAKAAMKEAGIGADDTDNAPASMGEAQASPDA